KYGKSRAQVESEIFQRLGRANSGQPSASSKPAFQNGAPNKPSGTSFLDEWLAKRQQVQGGTVQPPRPLASQAAPAPTTPAAPGAHQVSAAPGVPSSRAADSRKDMLSSQPLPTPTATPPSMDSLYLRGASANADSEVTIKL